MAVFSLLLETGMVLVVILLAVASIITVLLIDSLVRGWWQCCCMRANSPQLPPALSWSMLCQVSLDFSIRGCFAAAETWFHHSKQWSLELFPSCCVRRFVLVASPDLLRSTQTIVPILFN